MSSFSTQVIIAASVDNVWEQLSDFGNICEWNPNNRKSYLTSETSEGVGNYAVATMKMATSLKKVLWNGIHVVCLR